MMCHELGGLSPVGSAPGGAAVGGSWKEELQAALGSVFLAMPCGLTFRERDWESRLLGSHLGHAPALLCASVSPPVK